MASTQNKTQGFDLTKLVDSTEKPKKVFKKKLNKSKTGAFNMRTETEVKEQKEKIEEVMKPTLPKKEIIDEKKEIIDEKKDFNMNTKEIVEEEISDAETEIFENDEEIYNEIVEEKKEIVEEKKEIVVRKREIVATKKGTLDLFAENFDDKEEYYKKLQKLKEEYEVDVAEKTRDMKAISREMEKIHPERKITKPKKVKITKPKKAKFDVNAISVDDELDTTIEDHYPPIRAVVMGDIRTSYLGVQHKFNTLKEAHDYYKNTLKPMIDITDNKYCGIVKMNLGYMLKPIHEKGIIKWTANRQLKDKRVKTFVTWEFDESTLE